MRRWFAFQIGAVRWTAVIAAKPEFDRDGDAPDGLCDPHLCVIFVSEDVVSGGQDAAEECFLHELEHAIAISVGASEAFRSEPAEERYVNATTPLRYQAMAALGLKLPALPAKGRKR